MINDEALTTAYGVFSLGTDEKSEFQMAMSQRLKKIEGRHLRVICQFAGGRAANPIERLSFYLEEVQQPLNEKTVEGILKPFSDGQSWEIIGGQASGSRVLQRSDGALIARVDGLSVSFMSKECFLSRTNFSQ